MKIPPSVKPVKSVSLTKGEVKNTHRIRTAWEKQGIALIGAGTYVFDRIDLSAATDIAHKSPPKTAVPTVCVLEGDKGVLARVGKSEGSTFWPKSGGVISTLMFPKGTCRLVRPEVFRKEVSRKGHTATLSFRSKSGTKKVSGVGYVNAKKLYGFICPQTGTQLGDPVDFELKANKHNAGKVASIVSVN